MAEKPILFNTQMVKAILGGRKTQTRRVCKGQGDCNPVQIGYHPPYQTGDILWVRETWAEMPYGYVYRADDEKPDGWDAVDRWKPSIHMPKEAARIFLRAKDVRVERLRNMGYSDLANEGFSSWENFINLWDSTIKPADLDEYGWNADPWVWVIEFECCSKPDGWCDEAER